MKNKIKKFSKGDFRLIRPEIEISETNLVFLTGEGESYRGKFTLKNKGEGDIRGLVYTSSSRVKIFDQGFEGNPVEITFMYDSMNLKPGHVENGTFTIVCNGGEYTIHFTAIIGKPYLTSTHGRIQNVRDFKTLAVQDFSEALRMFRSKEFMEIIKYEEPRVCALYENMRKWNLGEQALEEFLVGIKQKEALFLTMDRTQGTFRNLKEETKETIHFTKNTWGYMSVDVHVDGDFIKINKNHFSTDDFVGNLFDFSYYVYPDKIHAGNNFGCITFETPYEVLTYNLLVTDHKDHSGIKREISMIFASIIKSYFSVYTGHLSMQEWADNSRRKLSNINIYTETDNVYPLIDAHLHILCDEPEKATSILDESGYGRFTFGKDPLVTSYYYYLIALIKKTGSFANKAVEELNKAYMKQPKSWNLVCMLVDVDPEYRNYSKRLQVLERHFLNGSNQVLLYWQALRCFLEHPATIKKLSSFEIQVLNFATKYNLISMDVALYAANLATQLRSYDRQLENVLKKIYKIFPDNQILTAICTLMIRGSRMTPECFTWYEKAVKEDLKIAQLYEFYIMTIDENNLKQELPKSIYLYFMHGNSLSYKKAALLYANLINYQDEMSELYDIYREKMERFAWEQLEARHISNALRIIYKRCLNERDMTADRMRAMHDICHAYEVTCSHPKIAYILVIESNGTISQQVPLHKEGSIVYLYDKDARIVLQSKDGRYFVDSIPYETIRLFYESRYIEMCKKFHFDTSDESRSEAKEVTWDNVKKLGLEFFPPEEVLKLCSMQIRELPNEEDEYLCHLCYELFEKEFYDKATLKYLSDFYCGATANMKKVWHVARDYDITTYKLSEKIITQMLFSEMVFGEEEIFADYYDGRTYFRLKQAYLAYISREYVVNGRQVKGCIFNIIANEYRKEESLPDICKIALLKYYSCREVHQALEPTLREFLREMCEKQLFFAFYMDYPENWLREVLLYDKTMIEYHAHSDSKVTISYQVIKDESEPLNYTNEVLLPAYEDTYVKTLILFDDEMVRYYFTESIDDKVILSEKKTYQPKHNRQIGKYGKLNDMSELKEDALSIAMNEYEVENVLAMEIFGSY